MKFVIQLLLLLCLIVPFAAHGDCQPALGSTMTLVDSFGLPMTIKSHDMNAIIIVQLKINPIGCKNDKGFKGIVSLTQSITCIKDCIYVRSNIVQKLRFKNGLSEPFTLNNNAYGVVISSFDVIGKNFVLSVKSNQYLVYPWTPFIYIRESY